MKTVAAVFPSLSEAGEDMFRSEAFPNIGISHEEAPLDEEAVRRGAVMVAACIDERLEEEAVAALKRHGARDLRDEADTWGHAGWSGPAHDPHPYVSDSAKRSV